MVFINSLDKFIEEFEKYKIDKDDVKIKRLIYRILIDDFNFELYLQIYYYLTAQGAYILIDKLNTVDLDAIYEKILCIYLPYNIIDLTDWYNGDWNLKPFENIHFLHKFYMLSPSNEHKEKWNEFVQKINSLYEKIKPDQIFRVKLLADAKKINSMYRGIQYEYNQYCDTTKLGLTSSSL